MWAIIKFDRKNLNLMIEDFKKKLGNDFVIYRPKILIQKYKNNKLVNKEFYLLNDYLFCFHKDFEKKSTLERLKFSKGLKYFLDGFFESQKDIKFFIERCKNLEDEKGYVSENLFGLDKNLSYKFSSGPFAEKIFKIINFEKNRINILIGGLKTTINRKEFFFNPV
tara:strand:- start:7550 stop:8047 length:498 start_codon:yes stop_codon:yes gene_type:complete